MFETLEELAALQQLVDRSFRTANKHLTSIMEPQRRLSAQRIVDELTDVVAVLNVATVSGRGEPRLSVVDGHFLHGHWVFTTSGDSGKSAMLRANPAISASWTPRDGFGVFCHGTARFLNGTPAATEVAEHFKLMYGLVPEDLAPTIDYVRIDPHWLVGFAMTDAEMVEVEASLAARQERLAAR